MNTTITNQSSHFTFRGLCMRMLQLISFLMGIILFLTGGCTNELADVPSNNESQVPKNPPTPIDLANTTEIAPIPTGDKDIKMHMEMKSYETDKDGFAQRLHDAIIVSVKEFSDAYPTETPYAYAIIPVQVGDYLMYAIATEQRLLQTSERYESLGYKYTGSVEGISNLETITTWLRWANPDDGWKFNDFPERFEITQNLTILVKEGEFGEDGVEVYDFCVEVLAKLSSDPEWQAVQTKGEIVVGVTFGEDPGDFFYSASQSNPEPLLKKLQTEYQEGEAFSKNIKCEYD